MKDDHLELGISLDDGSLVTMTPAERKQGTYIIGTTGTGKSTLLRNMIFQDMHPEKGRNAWCGASCGDRYLVSKGDQVAIRRLLMARGSTCELCGVDVRLLDRIRHAMERAEALLDPLGGAQTGRSLFAWLLGEMGWQAQTIRATSYRSLWDADHRVPLVEGGAHDLENLRVLCVACHRGETRELRRRLALSRRASLPPEPAPLFDQAGGSDQGTAA